MKEFFPCVSYPDDYQQQLKSKENHVNDLFENNFSSPLILTAIKNKKIITSPPNYFRARIEFALKKVDSVLHYIMFEPQSKKVCVIEHCSQALKCIDDAMPKLIQLLRNSNTLSERCFQVNFRANLEGELLITLIYHKKLNELWQQECNTIVQKTGWSIIGRYHKHTISVGNDYLDSRLNLDREKPLIYRQNDTTFTQPNPYINQEIINWIRVNLSSQSKQEDLLELYCGNGNLSLALCDKFNSILATEIVRQALTLAYHNQKVNDVENIQFVRLSADEVSSAFKQERDFRRLKNIDLLGYNFSTVLVDPPRSGIDKKTLNFIQRFEHIVYISCNPQTLCDDLKILLESHTMKSAALFDQFPYSQHIEMGVVLQKNSYFTQPIKKVSMLLAPYN